MQSKLQISLLLLQILLISCQKINSKTIEDSESNSISRRHERFFPIGWGVGLVRFENGLCTGEGGLQGTCYTRRQCQKIGGVRTSQCASGIGVCCIVQATCGETSSNNNTYFVSPNFPNSYTGGSTCTLTIPKCSPDICQIRIDFLTFNLAQPDDNGVCTNDAFYVIGGASNVPIICGENSGQHIYVDFNGDNDIKLVFNTNTATTASRAWNMKITQIGCDCPTKAPTGCLQYFTALSGTVRSFNYGSTVSQTGTRQLVNENYGVCVEMQPGYCSIRWSQSTGDSNSFTVSGPTFIDTGMGTVGTPAAALNNGNCTTDFVVIPNPEYVDAALGDLNTDRFCGNGFIPVTTGSKPFVLTVVTNGDEDVANMELGNRGFSLMYMQQQCAGSLLG